MSADVLTPAQRRRNMQSIRSRDTKHERLLEQMLKTLPVRFSSNTRGIPGRPDFVNRALKIAVFADGCFWHGCPRCGHVPKSNRAYWRKKLLRNVARDKEINRELRRAGWHVVRIWEHEMRGAMLRRKLKRLSRLCGEAS